MKLRTILACTLTILAACQWLSGCGSGSPTNVVTVSVSPSTATVLVNQKLQTISAFVSGATDTSVTWTCTFTTTTTSGTTTTTSSPAPCTSADGTLTNIQSTTVEYDAPATVPSPVPTISVTATSNADKKKSASAVITLDSGIRINVTPPTATVGTGETFKFQAAVTGDSPTNVTWSVKETNAGTIDNNGQYTAPGTVPTTPTATVVATSKTDPTRTGQATVTIVDSKNNQIAFSATNPIYPITAPLGGLLQDIYLNVTNLRSTVKVYFTALGTPLTNVNPIDPTSGQLRVVSSSVAALRLNAVQLSTKGTYTISVVVPDPTPTNPQQTKTLSQNLDIVPYRPAVISSVPDSFLQSPQAGSLSINGGFFGPSTDPAVSTQFNGATRSFSKGGPRQITVTLNGGDLGTPGLFPVSIVNTKATPSLAATNVAVQPDFTGTNGTSNPANFLHFDGSAASPMNSFPLALPDVQGVHPEPSSIAIDTTIGYAVFTEQATNTVQIINLNGASPALSGAPIAVGTAPTSVAIDDQLVQPNGDHVAVVVNNGSNSLTLVGIPSGTVINPKIDLTGLNPINPPPPPYAVGVDPFSHRALVAFSKANTGFIIDLNTASGNTCLVSGQPPCAISSVTLNTGAKPQIAFEPRIHLAFVTPGGSGQMSVVDLTGKSNNVQIADSPNGAVRTSNIVTIKTKAPHNLNPITPGTVLITNVTPPSFNGAFSVLSVVDGQTFTYAQTGNNETGGGGSIQFGNAALTFNVSNTVEGIAINPVSRTAVLADPNAGGNAFSSPIDFIGTLDQSITALSLQVGSFLSNTGNGPEIGAEFTAFQPFTNVALSLNPIRNEVSLIDPVKPQRLAPAISLSPAVTAGSYTPSGSTTPVSVNGAIGVDPTRNLALIANAGIDTSTTTPGNNITVLRLGTIKAVHIDRVLVPTGGVPNAVLPQSALTTNSPLNIQILGTGFAGAAIQVRLDGSSITASVNPANPRQIDATIPAVDLAVARRFALDVIANSVESNVTDFTVLGAVDVSATCGGTSQPQPSGVAIDEIRNIAVVTNTGCNTVSIIDIDPARSTYNTVIKTISVGAGPTGVDVISRLGLAVVSNNSAGTASILDIRNPANASIFSGVSDVTVGTAPNGVAINQDTGVAYVANTTSNTVSAIDLNPLFATPVGTLAAVNVGVDQTPIALAVDPVRQIAVVTTLPPSSIAGAASFGVLDILNVSAKTPTRSNSQSTFGQAIPTGIVFDPAAGFFYVTSSGNNLITALNPDTGGTRNIAVGVNPTSLSYNYQTGTILTVNSGSNTVSVIDSQSFKTRATLGISGSPKFASAIHPRTNLAVITDQANNRVLLFPLPN